MDHLPVFATAFRIFFLVCGVHAITVITLWTLKLSGIETAATILPGIYWHTYEMVFGFCRAAVFGFVFTAGQHWAGKFLLGGYSLVTLFILWTIGRFAFFSSPIFAHVAFAADLAASLFALYRMRVFMGREQKNNANVAYLFIFLTLAQTGAITAFFVAQVADQFLHFVRLGLLTIIFFVALIAGRVLPFFASVVIQGTKPRVIARIEKFVWPLTVLTLIAFLCIPLHVGMEKLSAVLFLATGLLHAARWYHWKPLAAVRIPILLILYVGYLWLVMGFLLLSPALVGWIPPSPAWHMFGIGAAGVFIFGMMTRVALGHTGRPIKAAGLISMAYLTLNAAMAVRVVLPLMGVTDKAYLFAAVLWILSFSIYLMTYASVLMRSRLDGRPG